jgi:uncharacterized lipoprotein YajG
MRRLICALTVAAMTSLAGCALTSEHIDLNYTPTANVKPVEGASSIPVGVVVSDVRTNKERVSSKINGYGQEMGAIISNQDVSTLVKSSLETELHNRGYPLDANGVAVVCEIYDFINKFQSGFWSGTAVASVRLNIKVRNRDGSYIFSEMVSGDGRTEKIQLATGSNAKPALDEALRKALDALFQRQDFYKSLQKAASK